MGGSQRSLQEFPIVDGHNDSLLDVFHGRRSLGVVSETGQADFPRLLEGGVKVQFFAVFIESQFKPHGAVLRAMEGIEFFYRELEKNPHMVHLIRTAKDLEQVLAQGKLGAVLTVEGGEALGGELKMLGILHRLGVRSLGLTWNQKNELADGVGAGKNPAGLTDFGREVIKEMNRLGMLVDLSHMAEKGFWEALEISTQPVIVSHGNCQQLCFHRRNLTDRQLKALSKQGGCVGITFVPGFIDPRFPTIERVLDHLEHAIQVMGIDHVGFGSDFDGMDTRIPGLETARDFPKLLLGLKERGYSKTDIIKVAGANWLRVLSEGLPNR